jgi:hypothetical protein
MGLIGIDGIDQCAGHGDDGIMQNTPSLLVQGCQASYPRFLSYTAGVNDPAQSANDFACIAQLGTDGCGFEQPLEAALKALWPSVDIDPATGNPIEPNRILFLPDDNGFGQLGHGDTDNAGFLRNDPAAGLSVIAVVVVSDEEDCSSRDNTHFRPAGMLNPSDPLSQQSMNLRCFFNPQNLYPLERYILGLEALRPGNENLVLFSAIVGVPPDLVTPESYGSVDWQNDSERDAFYQDIQNDPRMQEVVDSALPAEQGNLVPSCNTERGKAYPPRRIVEVARGFGANGSVQSICQEDFGPAIDTIVERIAGQLGAPCLPRALVRRADGSVGCELIWELPTPGAAPAATPVGCGQAGFDFLSEPTSGRAVSDRGGAVCQVDQLAVEGGEVQTTGGSAAGWYYDDFSEEVSTQCLGGGAQRIAFTPEAEPPFGVVVKLVCAVEQGDSCGEKPPAAEESRVGDACLPDIVPEGGFDDREAYVSTPSGYCGGGPCLVFHLRGDPSEGCIPREPDPNGSDQATFCATPLEVADRVYCSCRCDAPEGFAECDCADGFTCVDVLDQGDEAVVGGYCVRNGTFSR